jgi:hypothetical protein
MYDHFCEAADSVLAQTYNHVELVIVDDRHRCDARELNRHDAISTTQFPGIPAAHT